MHKNISKIAVLTSGGDAPGMNAAIRSVVRTGIYYGMDVYGINRGYHGMVNDDIFLMESKSVANIIQRGGTILKSARCMEFFTPEGRQKAYGNLQKHGIEGLIVIGGDGSFTGGLKLSTEFNFPVIGLPGTIDKDLFGSDYTIGFDTAVNTAIDAIDKIRDTADAHDRLFIVEVMGRHAGYLALYSGIATGAENILIPESQTNIEDVIASLSEKEKRKKLVNLIVVAEGDEFGGALEVAKVVKERLPQMDTRVSILGHIQRGGAPTCIDRILASRVGFHAVESMIQGRYNVMVGIKNDEITYTPLEIAIREKDKINEEWLRMVKILSS